MMYSYDSIRAVHLEVTDKCNAACPMCSRYNRTTGEQSDFVSNTQLSLEDIKKIFPIPFVQGLNRVTFCGNYGDPMVAKDVLPIIAYFKKHQPGIRIIFNTNGSARKESWWIALAKLIGDRGGVWFGLDGLEDTNHIYRRNTDWNIIMRNAKAYIAAGGHAYWNFLVFKHNEHQIEEANALSDAMGFQSFNIKLTGRFKTEQSFPVIVKGQHIYDLEVAEAERNQRPVVVNGPEIPPFVVSTPTPALPSLSQEDSDRILKDLRRKGFISGKTKPAPEPIPVIEDSPTIDCIAQREKCIYVSAQGLVFPCCWIGDAHYVDPQIRMSEDRISAFKRPIKDIIEGPEFQVVVDSWETGSIRRCVRFCGVKETVDNHPDEQHKVKYGGDYVIIRPRRTKE